MKLFAFTIDLEPDYGYANQYEIFKNHALIEKVLSILNSFNIKITVFVVGKIFELYPDIIKIFERYNCEFEVHSYSHDLDNPDSESEIEKAKLAYFNYFKKYPMGYRAPQGKISISGINALEKHGFFYDSSIFPSYFPNPSRYLFCKRQIHYYGNSKIMEIPFTSITPLRLTLSISYIKLFGINFFMKLFQLFNLPNIICFDSHLHDFIFNEISYGKLPYFWKFVHSPNKFLGMDYCIKFLEYIRQREYQFCYMSEIYELNKNKLSSISG